MTDSVKSEAHFNTLVDRFTAENEDVVLGKMMSSPGLKVNDKVFAFYHKGAMGFLLGPEFNPKKSKLSTIKPLNPFKTKGPLKGWYTVAGDEMKKWAKLAQSGLDFTRTLSR